jgi:hypothetical protein
MEVGLETKRRREYLEREMTGCHLRRGGGLEGGHTMWPPGRRVLPLLFFEVKAPLKRGAFLFIDCWLGGRSVCLKDHSSSFLSRPVYNAA